MFDDQPSNAPAIPPNLPVEPDDIFAGVEAPGAPLEAPPAASFSSPSTPDAPPDALAAGLLKKKVPESMPAARPVPMAENQVSSPPPLEAPPHFPVKEPVLGKVIIFLVGSIVLLGVVVGGWWGYQKYFAAKEGGKTDTALPAETVPSPTVPAPETVVATSSEDIANDVTAKSANDNLLFGEPIDSDKDALDDSREKEIGTNPNNSDSDNDGLSDADEVIIWKTNPLNPDTDGDTFQDGREVRSGYNPLGPGKLFISPPTASTTLEASTTVEKP